MSTIQIKGKELKFELNGSVKDKARNMNVTENMIKSLIQGNQDSIENTERQEEILLVGNPSITFLILFGKLTVTNIFRKQNIF